MKLYSKLATPAAFLASISMSAAAITAVNLNFDGQAETNDLPGAWDDTVGNPWEQFSIDVDSIPGGYSSTGVVLMSGSPNAASNWLYVSLGDFAAGDPTTVDWSLDIGGYSDAGAVIRSGTVYIDILESGTFAPAEGTDIAPGGTPAAGVSQLGIENTGVVSYAGTAFGTHNGSIDISGATVGNTIYARMAYVPDYSGASNGYLWSNDITFTPVPEPATATLFGLGLLGVLFRRRR